MKIDLPGDAWAHLRDPDAVTEKQRKPMLTAIGRVAKMENADDGGMAVVFAVQDTLVMALVESWSFETPVTLEGFEDLPFKVVDALRAACEPLRDALMPTFGPSRDADSPTLPSDA